MVLARGLGLLAGVGLGMACAATPVRVHVDGATGGAAEVEALRALSEARRPDEGAAYRDGAWDPAYFDTLVPADPLRIEGLRQRHRRSGRGVPLVGLRLPDPIAEAHYPPEGITRPVTAVVQSDGAGRPVVRLLDPFHHSRVDAPDGPRPLAADFTAPYALLLSRTRLERNKLTGALRPGSRAVRSGIYLLQRYDPEKIPLLMIHGLLASPLTWRELTNSVWGDADLRSRYQVWHAVYPTGLPYLHAAGDLREQLGGLLQRLDPEGRDYATAHLVVVAHSKGGLLAKTLVSDSGATLWEAAFTVPAEELVASPDDRAEMERFLTFERNPAVERVVFIATPHRGSRLAENPVARLLGSWVSLPGGRRGPFERVLSANEDRLAEGFRVRRRTGLPSGPRALSQRDPLIGPLADLPVDPRVPFHSIVGQARPGLLSDGVVDHASSHLEGAQSELVVRDGHGVHRSEAAIAEVLRVLRAHPGR